MNCLSFITLPPAHRCCGACGKFIDPPLAYEEVSPRTPLENAVLKDDLDERLVVCCYCGHMMVFCPYSGFWRLSPDEIKVMQDNPVFMEIRNKHVEMIFRHQNYWG